ncbi:MAG: UDP-N-acetylglucosamine 1-carboxyvinyltransferase [Patescibacteria group bacterium]|jgi:UDP-N-acetylglucosamine 1-carboxyvinyltransferase
MQTLFVEGGKPLVGSVRLSGAKNSALKLIPAAMFSNEDITLENIPRIGNVENDLEAIRAIGGKAEWTGPKTLVLNGAGLNTFEIPYDLGSKYRTAALLAAPLVFRFGKAVIPQPGGCKIGYRPINRWIDVWNSMGIEVTEEELYVSLNAKAFTGTDINFKISTHMGTDNAILSAIAAHGETTISNAAEECEVDDLIAFCNMMGAQVERTEPRRIKITGRNVFKGGSFKVQADRNEAVTYAVAALVTGGNITLEGAEKTHLTAFINVLSKMGANFEFMKEEMRVWHTNQELLPVTITTLPAPGFMTDWQPLGVLLCTRAHGESLVHDTIYTDRFGYTKDLNRMGANIELFQPTSLGIESVISDDMYDLKKMGEPFTVAKVIGPSKLRGTRMDVPDLRAGATLILAALSAEGRSEINGYENVIRGYEDFADKLTNLGARLH